MNIFKTNLATFFLILLTVLSVNFSHAQSAECMANAFGSQNFSSSFCSPQNGYSYSIDPAVLASYPQETISVYFWGINQSNGSSANPFNTVKLQESIDLLNSAFADMNLCFELKGYEEINDDSIYFNSASSLISYVGQNPTKRDPNAVNIYIPFKFTNFNNNLRGFQWGANYMAVNSYEYNTGIFVHEMGHVFRLLHTHQNWNSTSCERVTRDPNDPDYNANCSGDHVIDTNAMRELNNNSNAITSACRYIGSFSDCDGTPYTITEEDIRNYMSYTLQHCRDRFTVGQGIRVREYLTNFAASLNYINAPNEDLFTANSINDIGIEPDTYTNVIWESPDIWVRNQPDGFVNQVHEDLEYVNDTTPVYVYVKIRNRGCESSGGNDILELYWAKGGLNQEWEDVWKGLDNPPGGLQIGNEVGTQNIPSVDSGDETILQFQWQPLNPTLYSDAGFNKPWMFCFLSRIESQEDTMTFVQGTNAATNTRNNNNIAYKNTTVLDVSGNSDIGSIIAGNFNNDQSITSDIIFFTNQNNSIFQEAEIRVTLDETLWDAWQDSGANSTDVRVLNTTKREIYLSGNNASLDNILFESSEWGILTPRINFLIREVTGETYTLNVAQNISSSGEILGGFTYHVNRNDGRQYFQAGATLVENNLNTALVAEDINENAIYNWYDEDGNYISSGTSLVINNASEKEYKLEVIADSDGHKDYETFTVKEKRAINSLSPNPTVNVFTVDYNVGNATSAFIQVTNVSTGNQLNYLIDLSQNYKSIDLSTQPFGQYIVNLVTDNVIVDSKILIKN